MLCLAGCSGGGDADDPGAPETPDPGTGTTSATPTEPTPTLPGGSDASSDLSSFVCEPGPVGDWTATGVITSSATTVASVEVTVVVAGADADNPDGRQRLLSDLEPDVPTDFEIDQIPAAPSPDATCQVKVVRLDP